MSSSKTFEHTMSCMEVWGGNRAAESGVEVPGLQAWVYCRPFGAAADEGGDIYYVSSCATGRITRLLVADVSGHGSAVGRIADGLRGMMRRYVNFIDQTRFVREMNTQFSAMASAGGFATALVTTFFSPTRSLSVCNAGHPPPAVFRARTQRWSLLECAVAESADDDSPAGEAAIANIPLGILDLTDYEQFEVTLGVGDMILCHTDSLTESKNAAGRMLGEAGFLQVLQSVPIADPAKFTASLLDHLAKLHPGNLANDDVTVLLFRSNGSGVAVPIRDRLLAPLRVVGGIVKSIFSRSPLPIPQFSIANLGGVMLSALNRVGKPQSLIAEESLPICDLKVAKESSGSRG